VRRYKLLASHPSGKPVPDKKTKATAVPSWVDDPFVEDSAIEVPPRRQSSKGVRYVAFKTLEWRATTSKGPPSSLVQLRNTVWTGVTRDTMPIPVMSRCSN
jgi:hypothetical protein